MRLPINLSITFLNIIAAAYQHLLVCQWGKAVQRKYCVSSAVIILASKKRTACVIWEAHNVILGTACSAASSVTGVMMIHQYLLFWYSFPSRQLFVFSSSSLSNWVTLSMETLHSMSVCMLKCFLPRVFCQHKIYFMRTSRESLEHAPKKKKLCKPLRSTSHEINNNPFEYCLNAAASLKHA